jgi:hypothetical protein
MSAPETKNWSGTGQLRGGKRGIAFFTTLIRFFGPGDRLWVRHSAGALFQLRLARRAGHDGFSPAHVRPSAVVETALVCVQTFLLVWPRHH